MVFEAFASPIARGVLLTLVLAHGAAAQSPGATTPRPNLGSNIERPLRYRADAGDFVIVNGAETFNRPLYGRNTAFRVDGGDRPEFVLYLPGRGGNLRLGLRAEAQSKWLIDAAQITTRYRPGELLYEIRDPLLGVRGVLQIHLLALHETDGLVLRAAYRRAAIRNLRSSSSPPMEESTVSAVRAMVTSAPNGFPSASGFNSRPNSAVATLSLSSATHSSCAAPWQGSPACCRTTPGLLSVTQSTGPI